MIIAGSGAIIEVEPIGALADNATGEAFLRRVLAGALMLVCSGMLFGQTLDPFAPENPSVMGRGGSFTATANGYNSFFTNPAGFAGEGEFTVASANTWAFMDDALVGLVTDLLTGNSAIPSAGSSSDPAAFESLSDSFTALSDWVADEDPAVMEDILQTAAGDTGITFSSEDDFSTFLATAGAEDLVGFLEAVDAAAEANGASIYGTAGYPDTTVDDLVAAVDAALPRGRLRVGAQIGLGYAGNGIGVGLFANAEASFDGSNILQASGIAYNTITFVGGLGLSFGALDLGISVRPMVFGYSRASAGPIVGSFLSGGTVDYTAMFDGAVFYGSGLGVDVGALFHLGPFTLGASVRDLLGTRILYRKSSFDEYFQALLEASLPAGSELSAEQERGAISFPMKVNLGFEFHPDLGVLSFLFDPSVSVDLLDVTSAVRSWQAGQAVTGDQLVDMLNFGGQVRLLRFMTVQAGYYGGFLSAGLGMEILMLQINTAVAGDFGFDDAGSLGFTEVGGSIEIGIRF